MHFHLSSDDGELRGQKAVVMVWYIIECSRLCCFGVSIVWIGSLWIHSRLTRLFDVIKMMLSTNQIGCFAHRVLNFLSEKLLSREECGMRARSEFLEFACNNY